MPKVTGPLMSLGAHGSIADTLTFRRSVRGHVARKWAKPTGPASAAQIAHRLQFSELCDLWNDASAEDKASWSSLAAADDITNYAAFTRFNWDRILHDLDPSAVYPPIIVPAYPLLATAGDPAPSPDCTGYYQQIENIAGSPAYQRVPTLDYWILRHQYGGFYFIHIAPNPTSPIVMWNRGLNVVTGTYQPGTKTGRVIVTLT